MTYLDMLRHGPRRGVDRRADVPDGPPDQAKDDLLAGPITHRKALPHEQCDDCRELEAKGVRVIHCSTCDQRVKEEPPERDQGTHA